MDDDEPGLNDFFQQAVANTLPYADVFDDLPEPQYLKCGIAEHRIRFRTVAYGRLQLAPHVQPWEHRVTMRVRLIDIPLKTPLEQKLLHEIVGTRLKKDVLQLSSNQFGSRIENKRHLVSMLDRIVLGAKKLAQELELQPDHPPPQPPCSPSQERVD
jgi:Mitochondrial ribosomal subunit protein